MTYLPYIIPSYALGILVPGGFGVAAFLRMRRAARRLAAIDPRRARGRDARGRDTRRGDPS